MTILSGWSLQWRGSVEGKAARLAVEAANLDVVEQERGSDDGARKAALRRRAEGAERGAREAVLRILHVGERAGIVADGQDIAQRAQRKAFEESAARQFLMAIGDVHAIDEQGRAFAAGDSAAQLADKFREIVVVHGGERGIIHALHFDAPFVAIGFAGVEKFLAQVVRLERVGGLQEKIT